MALPRARMRSGRTFIRYVQDIPEGYDGFDQLLVLFLRKSSHLIPEVRTFPQMPELISVLHVCFAMLDKVTEVKIE